jgi:hypothetical protein
VIDAVGADIKAGEAPATAGGASAAPAAAPGGTAKKQLAGVDLWDSGWPSGRYYWAVVPVSIYALASAAPGEDTAIGYQDTAIPQDSCEGGQVMSFGKVSAPVVTSAGKPFVSGVAPSGRSVAGAGTRPVVYESPIVAWQPAVGATKYQIELSRTKYPWRPERKLGTPATSVQLPLAKVDKGTWYYKVRGVNEALPVGAQRMSWSPPVSIQITGDRFKIVK